MGFNKLVKTRWNNPATGGFEIRDWKAKDIVANPSRHEHDPILAAVCSCVTELVRREEEREERLKSILGSKHIPESEFHTIGSEA